MKQLGLCLAFGLIACHVLGNPLISRLQRLEKTLSQFLLGHPLPASHPPPSPSYQRSFTPPAYEHSNGLLPGSSHHLLERWMPSMDMYETDSHVYANLELAGVPKDKIQVQVNENTLRVTGEVVDLVMHPSEVQEEDKLDDKEMSMVGRHQHVNERLYGRFYRQVSLPDGIDPDAVDAKYENGILYLSIPKAKAPAFKRVSVH
jgi:HSP20 family protein